MAPKNFSHAGKSSKIFWLLYLLPPRLAIFTLCATCTTFCDVKSFWVVNYTSEKQRVVSSTGDHWSFCSVIISWASNTLLSKTTHCKNSKINWELATFRGEIQLQEFKKVMRKQWTGTGAIRRQIPLSKPKWKITKITNKQNTTRTNGQPSGQLFSKMRSLSNPNRTKSIINKYKVKHHGNSDTKKRFLRTTSEPPPWNVLIY